ncbi:hypothetical protein GCM10010254_68690 [Streptomyces chromofuscus]|nr:hypothetical protein GCM10010254_68690 [Streptomyces chromofuscus]
MPQGGRPPCPVTFPRRRARGRPTDRPTPMGLGRSVLGARSRGGYGTSGGGVVAPGRRIVTTVPPPSAVLSDTSPPGQGPAD